MDAREIMAQLENRYAECRTYRDSGRSYTWRDYPRKTRLPQIIFSTYFERPSKFRFQWQDKDSTGMIWCDGNMSYMIRDSYNSGAVKEEHESLLMAIAVAAGVSRTTSYVIPHLLVDEICDMRDPDWETFFLRTDVGLTEDQTVGDEECFSIIGSNFSKRDELLSVSKRDLSLRRHLSYTVVNRVERGPKLILTTQELGPSDSHLSEDGSMLLSTHHPPNLITRREAAHFKELFKGGDSLVEEPLYEEINYSDRNSYLNPANYFDEIIYDTVVFDEEIAPAKFTSIGLGDSIEG